MKIKLTASAVLLLAAAAFSMPTVRAQQDILVNSGFEADDAYLDPGNNIGSVPSGWTVTGGESNLDTGSGSIPAYDGPFSGGSDGSTGGTTIFDGTQSTQDDGDVTLSQTFTLNTATDLGGTFAIGDRDGNGANVNALFSITGADAGNTFSYSFEGNAPVYDEWTVYAFDAGMLPAGDYTVSFDLPDTDNVDAVAFGVGIGTAVPEPSTWAVMAAGGVVLACVVRSRRRKGAGTSVD